MTLQGFLNDGVIADRGTECVRSARHHVTAIRQLADTKVVIHDNVDRAWNQLRHEPDIEPLPPEAQVGLHDPNVVGFDKPPIDGVGIRWLSWIRKIGPPLFVGVDEVNRIGKSFRRDPR